MKTKAITKKYNYFVELQKLVEFNVKAAQFLHQTMEKFDGDVSEQCVEAIHDIEHQADLCKHTMMNRLMKEFITPIEREDIISLAQKIDDVTDFIEDVIIKCHIFNITELREGVLEFTQQLLGCCNMLNQAMKEFGNFKKSKTLHDLLIEINNIEEVGDSLYTKAIRELYLKPSDTLEVVIWTEIYECLEQCFDACEDVADDIETVVMKNS